MIDEKTNTKKSEEPSKEQIERCNKKRASIQKVHDTIFTEKGRQVLGIYTRVSRLEEEEYDPEALIKELMKILKNRTTVDVVCATSFILADAISSSFDFDRFEEELSRIKTTSYIH